MGGVEFRASLGYTLNKQNKIIMERIQLTMVLSKILGRKGGLDGVVHLFIMIIALLSPSLYCE